MAPTGLWPTEDGAEPDGSLAAVATREAVRARTRARVREWLLVGGLGLVSALLHTYAKLRLGIPGHSAMLWLTPVLAARRLGRGRAAASVSSTTAAAGMAALGGFGLRWPVFLEFGTFWLVGPALDLLCALPGALGPARDADPPRRGIREGCIMLTLGLCANWVHLALKLLYGVIRPHAPRFGLGPHLYEIVTYAVFGLVAGGLAFGFTRPVRSRGRRAGGFTLVELLVVIGIIAVLSGLLLPVLSSARESGRRTTCMSNLDQIGKGLAIYTGRFDGYFPCWHGYGSLAEDVRYSDGATSRVADVADASKPGIHDMRALGTSKKESGGATAWSPGDLARCPINLGFLILTDIVAEGRVFRCPSSGQDGVDAIWKKIGGLSRQALLYGYDLNTGTQQPHVKSHYDYRNAAIDLADDVPRALTWTRPTVTASPNCPPFKTQTLLKGRAICADSFDRAFVDGGPDDNPNPGRGDEGHEDGYNVLYGEGHVRWYGDAAQQIIWYWPEYRAAGSGNPDPCHDWIDRSNLGAHEVWNLFDRHAGIDAP